VNAIYVKELKQYFKSTIGYIFLSIFLLICGFYFTTGNLFSQDGDIKTFFSSIFAILVFLIPILTMRLFAEERKMKTQQLLFTMPISTGAVVLGKFFATLTVFLIGLAVTLIYPAILAYYGSFELMVTLGNYLGIILMVSAFISIGIFISILTENQLVAAVVSYCVLLALMLIDSVGVFVSSSFLRSFFSYVSLSNNFREFTMGIFNPASVIYYLSITAFFVFLSIFAIENRKAS
jgi:ABC-2 type transport system permease protein